jgi:hypothetical protein
MLRVLCAAALAVLAHAQGFGGSPPWGPEKPVHFQGEINQSGSFEHPIGEGFYFQLSSTAYGFSLGVLGKNPDRVVPNCEWPLHGPRPDEIEAWDLLPTNRGYGRGFGDKRWLECMWLGPDNQPHGSETYMTFRDHPPSVNGLCWLRPLDAKIHHSSELNADVIDWMQFDGECALHGGWELWRLPATYVIPPDFSGWVAICFQGVGQPELKPENNRYLIPVSGSRIKTSSNLRNDSRGAKFVSPDGSELPAKGKDRTIWGWTITGSPAQVFFVGTNEQYVQHRRDNPVLQRQGLSCPSSHIGGFPD